MLIICGFAGIGKTTVAHNVVNVVDLESTPFEKDWQRYVKVARHMADNGYIVLVSCHKELREEFYRQGIAYTLALPSKDKKECHIKRYEDRGNTDGFIQLLSNNWDSFLSVLPHEKDILIVYDYLANYIIAFRK